MEKEIEEYLENNDYSRGGGQYILEVDDMIEMISLFTKQLQSDKETLLEALKEAMDEIHDLTFVTTDEFSTKTSALQEAKDAVKKYDEAITKATNP